MPEKGASVPADWSAGAMLRTWQFYALVFLFIGSAQSGLLVIANAAITFIAVPLVLLLPRMILNARDGDSPKRGAELVPASAKVIEE